MSISTDFQLEDPVEDFVCKEGFARITRDGQSDIYVVQNQEYPGDHRFSLAFALDDFDPTDATKIYGEPLILNATDDVAFLGRAEDYFLPRAPLWEDNLAVVRMVSKEAGLLPAIRAIEHLCAKGVRPTAEELRSSVDYHVADYHRRRALLIA